jgi:hypothetical protein
LCGLLVTGARAHGNHGKAGSSGRDGSLKLAQTSSSSLGQLRGGVGLDGLARLETCRYRRCRVDHQRGGDRPGKPGWQPLPASVPGHASLCCAAVLLGWEAGAVLNRSTSCRCIDVQLYGKRSLRSSVSAYIRSRCRQDPRPSFPVERFNAWPGSAARASRVVAPQSRFIGPESPIQCVRVFGTSVGLWGDGERFNGARAPPASR